jgi:hypothetical protein
MYILRVFSLILVTFSSFLSINAQSVQPMGQLINEQFAFAAKQLQVLDRNVPDSMMPRTFVPQTGSMVTSNTKWWCSGFFPASLLYVYEHTKDPAVLGIAKKEIGHSGKRKALYWESRFGIHDF